MDFADGFRIGLPFFLPVDPSYDTRLQALDNASVLLGRHRRQGRRRVQPDRRHAAVHRFREQPLPLRLGRRVHELRDAGPPLRHLLGRVGQRRRRLPRRSRDHRTGAALPAVGDGAGGPPRPARAATAPHAGAGALPAGHVDPARPAERSTSASAGRARGTPTCSSRRRIRSSRPISTIPAFRPTAGFPTTSTTSSPSGAGVGRRRRRTHGGAGPTPGPTSRASRCSSSRGTAPPTAPFSRFIFRSSAASPALGPVPPLDRQIDGSATLPFLPDIQVADRNLELPRTWSFSAAVDRDLRARPRRRRHRHPRPDRQPVPIRQPQRSRPRRAFRGRDPPRGRWTGRP